MCDLCVERATSKIRKLLQETHFLTKLNVTAAAITLVASGARYGRRSDTRYATAETLAVSSMPKAFMTASVVFKVGLPFSLNER